MTAESEWQRVALEAARTAGIANQRMDDHMRECSERYKDLKRETVALRESMQSETTAMRDSFRKGMDGMKTLLVTMAVTIAVGCLGLIGTLIGLHH